MTSVTGAPLPRFERPECVIREPVLTLDGLVKHKDRILCDSNISKMEKVGLQYVKVSLDDGVRTGTPRKACIRLTGVYSKFGLDVPKEDPSKPKNPHSKQSYSFSAPERENMALASILVPTLDDAFKAQIHKNAHKYWPKEWAQCKDDASREMFVNTKYKSFCRAQDDEEKAEKFGRDLKFSATAGEINIIKKNGRYAQESECLKIKGTYNLLIEIPRLNFQAGKTSISPKISIVGMEVFPETDETDWEKALCGETVSDNNSSNNNNNHMNIDAAGSSSPSKKRKRNDDESQDVDGNGPNHHNNTGANEQEGETDQGGDEQQAHKARKASNGAAVGVDANGEPSSPAEQGDNESATDDNSTVDAPGMIERSYSGLQGVTAGVE
jgi:hypothetical protein